jgi:hypothetical protein
VPNSIAKTSTNIKEIIISLVMDFNNFNDFGSMFGALIFCGENRKVFSKQLPM